MALSLEQLRNAYKTPDKEQQNSMGNNYFPFWNAQIGETVAVRFLPDKNPENPLGFLVEKLMHTLEINGEKKSVPCLKMYGEECPICKVSAQYYKANDKVNGKKFWRKKQHLAQALVIADPLPPDEQTKETHVGKVRYMALGYQIYNIIKESFESGVLDEIPYAYKGGTNFIIKKSKQGEYSTYAVGSRFDRTPSDLSADEIAMIQGQLIDLSTLLPKNPGMEKVEAMLEAALTGGTVANDANTPSSNEELEGSEMSPPWEANARPAASDRPAAVVQPAASSTLDADADEILRKIRERKKAQV